jgi:predicted protein tyrosine phosphatase
MGLRTSSAVFVSQLDAEEMQAVSGWAMISITDPGCADADIDEGWGAILRVKFHDIDTSMGERFELMSKSTATEIIDFLLSIKGSAKGIVVHCRAGASRSASVAAIASNLLGFELDGNAEAFNPHVFRILRRAAFFKALRAFNASLLRTSFASSPK